MEHRETNVPWSTPPELWEKLKPLARQMRLLPTPAEEALWQRLRNRQVSGWKFRRQHTMDRFVVDFYCSDARLIIEVDGAVHEYTQDEDALRTEFLESMGMRVIRFSNDDVLRRMEIVLARVEQIISHAAD